MARKDTDSDDEDVQKPQEESDAEGSEGAESSGGWKRYLNVKTLYNELKPWILENKLKAGLIAGGALLLLIAIVSLLYLWRASVLAARPTVEKTIETLDARDIATAKSMAESVLKYAKDSDTVSRGGALFVLGVTTSMQADVAWAVDKSPYYLAAANYLEESRSLGYYEGKKATGDYYLGKCLYLAGEYSRARQPLLDALGNGYEDTKTIYWYLGNAYFRDSNFDLDLSLRYLNHFRETKPIEPEEEHLAHLMSLLVLLRKGEIATARQEILSIPNDPSYESTYHFVRAQILMEEARSYRNRASNLEQQYLLTPSLDVAPPQVPESSVDDLLKRTPIGSTGQPDASSLDIERLENILETVPPPDLDTEPVEIPDGLTPLPENTLEISGVSRNFIEPDNRFLAFMQGELDYWDDDTSLLPPERARRFRTESLRYYEAAMDEFSRAQSADAAEFLWGRQSIMLQGMCQDEMGYIDDALKTYRNLADGFPDSSEAISAEFLHAELEERLGNTDRAYEGFRRTLRKLLNKSDYANPWLTRKDMEQRLQEIFAKRLETGLYPEAFKLLDLLDAVLPKGRMARLRAVGFQRWAENLQTRVDAAAFDQREALSEEAKEKYRMAGIWFSQLAHWEYTTDQYVDNIWYSAEYYRLGRDYRRAIPQYLKFLEIDTVNRQPITLVYLGEMYFELDFLDRASEYLDKCMEYYSDRTISYYAALLSSYVEMEKKDYTKAKRLLERNLSGILGPDSPEFRDSLFALGRLYYKQRDYENAIYSLEDAITWHPNAIQAPESHYLIALGYMELIKAKQREEGLVLAVERQQITGQINDWRESALKNLERAQELITNRDDAVNLSVAEQKMLRNCYFAIGGVMVELGPDYYRKAIDAYNAAATRYHNIPESLHALVRIANLYRLQGKNREAREVTTRAKMLLERLTAAGAFREGERFTSGEWEELLEWMQKI